MPIAVKDHQFQQTDKTVYITVPLKGVKPNKVDIFSTEQYIKVKFLLLSPNIETVTMETKHAIDHVHALGADAWCLWACLT